MRTDDHDSDKLMAYRKARDAYLLAEQRYTAASMTAANAQSDEKLEWQHTTGPMLRRELAELMQTWIFDGFKDEIETAQVQVATLGARSPALAWAEWQGRYNPDIDAIHDALDGTSVMPSGFSPSNAISNEAWRSFTLSPAEVSTLLQEAPPDWVQAMLGAAPRQATQTIKFEFSSAAIVRPWFDPGVFKARFWRFAEASRKLSDGKTPPTGECPAYVTALVFARKVNVTGTDPRTIPLPTEPFEGFRFAEAAHLARADVLKPKDSPLNDSSLERGEIPPHSLGRRRHSGTVPAGEHLVARNRVFEAGNTTFNTKAAAAAVHAPIAATAVPTAAISARGLAWFNRLKIDRSPDRVQPTSPSPPSQPVAMEETIYVLAFICKSLAQCPDPDPDLRW